MLTLCSSGCQTFLTQVQRDENIQALLNAIHDAFDFTQEADPLKNITPQSKQGHILKLMLQHVCCCSDFIQSYAQDIQFCTSSFVSLAIANMCSAGKRFLKNISGQVDKRIEDLCTLLVELRKAFLDHATVTTEITVLQILDDVGILSAHISGISTRLDGMTTQLKWVSSQVSDLGM